MRRCKRGLLRAAPRRSAPGGGNMSPVLRPYQQRLVEQLAAATDKRILIV